MEKMGGGRQRELEKELLEARMANARLMEDNESYQLLLSEKTLNGDFGKSDFLHETAASPTTKEAPDNLGSLADELESVAEGGVAENTRKLEAEIKALKDQNKALTLYIERIIGRLLQHEGFETILDKNENDPPVNKPRSATNTDKELPPTPSQKDQQSGTFLQRAKTAVGGQSNTATTTTATTANDDHNRPRHRSRPSSYMPPQPIGPTPHENPETAPSIPLARSQSMRAAHRRTRSDQANGTAAAVVGQMYRGPLGRSTSGSPMSPGISPTMGPGSRQSGLFSAAISSASTGGRASSLSSQRERNRLSGSDSVVSDPNNDSGSTEATSSPGRSSSIMTNYPGAVMAQNKLRPLRLVQENEAEKAEEEAAKKKANRGSWISWFSRSNQDDTTKT
ncbi:hypothetical protein VTN02DRAFT_3422 [Thermoascus thermophilus]